MKTLIGLCLTLTALMLTGCSNCCDIPPSAEFNSETNAEMVNRIDDIAIHNAILRQHTLYPYHFEIDAPELNGLGRRDFDVLASHFRKYPGSLSLRKGDASDKLYKARLDAVNDALVKAGVTKDRVTLADVPPGGDGISSDQALRILKQPPNRAIADYTDNPTEPVETQPPTMQANP